MRATGARAEPDPVPLLHQLQARYGDMVAIEYVQRSPGEIVIDFVRR